jgi:hypothetical protein
MAQARGYIGQVIGNRLILDQRYSEPMKDGKRKSLFAWRCLACKAESESVLSVLTSAAKANRTVCAECTTARDATAIPVGTVINRLVVTGPCQRGKRNGESGWKRIVPVKCTSCGKEALLHKSSLHAGTANCRCELNTLDGKSRTPEGLLFQHARQRAADQGVPFEIALDDIAIPETCPVLGLPLASGSGGMVPTSPTLDKIIPALGYVPGNVAVISWRANKLKSDGALEELELVVAWMRKQKKGQP